jgi:hypothetical protein
VRAPRPPDVVVDALPPSSEPDPGRLSRYDTTVRLVLCVIAEAGEALSRRAIASRVTSTRADGAPSVHHKTITRAVGLLVDGGDVVDGRGGLSPTEAGRRLAQDLLAGVE